MVTSYKLPSSKKKVIQYNEVRTVHNNLIKCNEIQCYSISATLDNTIHQNIMTEINPPVLTMYIFPFIVKTQ